MQRRDLHAPIVDQLGMADVQPAVFDGLAMQISAGIRRGERDLDRVWVDFRGKPDGLLDRLFRYAGKPENEGPVDRDPELVAVLRKAPGNVDPHALLDVVEDLLIASFI